MYKITIMVGEEDTFLELKTEKRALARAALLLCTENNVACEVVREVPVVSVKFKGIGDEKKADVTSAPKLVLPKLISKK